MPNGENEEEYSVKKGKRISISKQLFRTYALVCLIFFLVTSAATTVFLSTTIDRYIIETRKNTTDGISRAISRYFEDMNEFSLSLMNDGSFKEAVLEQLPNTLDSGTPQSTILQQVYNSAYKMIENGYRIGVACKDGTYIWLGDRILVKPLDSPVHTYDNYHGWGKPLLTVLERNEFLCHIDGGEKSTFSDSPLLTLSRSINRRNHFTQPQAMLEIQVSQNEFNAYIEKLQGIGGSDRLSITILSGAQCLYGDPPSEEILQRANDQWQNFGGNMIRRSQVFGEDVLVYYAIPVRRYYRPLGVYLTAVALFYLLTLGVMLAVSYYVSKKMTRPIHALSSQLKSLSLTTPEPLPRVNTNITELDLMAQTVSQMSSQLNQTMQEIVVAQTAEMQSHFMALQSQMEPHFLHNTLAVISSLSEQGKASEVSQMCRNLSKMLRYVSTKEETGVTISEELLFLKSYLAIMQERFPKTQVQVDIPLDLMECRIPKLSLQPLCENTFKYAGRTDIALRVTGWSEEDRWKIRVEDNGPGFSPETIEHITGRCRQLFTQKSTLSAQIDGMGLVNIYARLALFYKENFIFEITPQNGITIGGSIHADKNQCRPS